MHKHARAIDYNENPFIVIWEVTDDYMESEPFCVYIPERMREKGESQTVFA